jgi:hypothetical protein
MLLVGVYRLRSGNEGEVTARRRKSDNFRTKVERQLHKLLLEDWRRHRRETARELSGARSQQQAVECFASLSNSLFPLEQRYFER